MPIESWIALVLLLNLSVYMNLGGPDLGSRYLALTASGPRKQDQLDAIVDATEGATNTILGTVEEISQSIDDRRGDLEAAGLGDWAGEIDQKFQAIFEACSFQDITGQRITKIVGELKFIDERLNSMIDIWGPEGLIEEPVPEPADITPEGEKLEGPALAGQGVSQDEIDKMFD